MRTCKEIVNEALELADTFYQMFGYISRPGFKYYESSHPQEQLVWAMACAAYDHVEGTDVWECLDELEEECSGESN